MDYEIPKLTRAQINALIAVVLLIRKKISEGKPPYVTASELAPALGRSETRARNLLNELRRAGLLKSLSSVPLIFGKEVDSRQVLWTTVFDSKDDEVIKQIIEKHADLVDKEMIYNCLQNLQKCLVD